MLLFICIAWVAWVLVQNDTTALFYLLADGLLLLLTCGLLNRGFAVAVANTQIDRKDTPDFISLLVAVLVFIDSVGNR